MTTALEPDPGLDDPAEWLRLLLVDDHTLFREGLAELLTLEADLRVVGQAADSETAVRLAAAARPDAVLLDVEMPYAPVHESIVRIRHACPGARILVLTMHDDPHLASQCVEAGAYGLLAKSVTRQQLVHAVRAIAYRDEIVAPPRRALPSGPPAAGLSPRERQVLELAGQALSNAQIGARLFITEGTVKRHLTNIYAKLGAVSRLDAVNKAVALRWIRPRVP